LRNHIELQGISSLVDEFQIANERRAAKISLESWLDRRKTFCQFYEKATSPGLLKDEQARAAVTEGDLADIDSVPQQVEVG
jgi:hypothetical protein